MRDFLFTCRGEDEHEEKIHIRRIFRDICLCGKSVTTGQTFLVEYITEHGREEICEECASRLAIEKLSGGFRSDWK